MLSSSSVSSTRSRFNIGDGDERAGVRESLAMLSGLLPSVPHHPFIEMESVYHRLEGAAVRQKGHDPDHHREVGVQAIEDRASALREGLLAVWQVNYSSKM